MKIAVLPFNSAEGTKQAFGRQFAAFMGDQLRTASDADVNTVSFLAEVEQEGQPRVGFVNITDGFLELPQVAGMIEQTGVDLLTDGFLQQDGDNFDLSVRFHKAGLPEPVATDDYKFTSADIFNTLHKLVKRLAEVAEIQLPDELAGEEMEFGTANAESMMAFLEGYDAFHYVQQAGPRVVQEFDYRIGTESLLKALELDADFVAPYETLCEYARTLAQHQVGDYQGILGALKKATELVPGEWRAYYVLGELLGMGGAHGDAAAAFEKAIEREPNESALYTRLGMAQMNMGMPVNAERNFRKAVEMEDENKPTMDMLAGVLEQTGRGHEVPALWKEMVEKYPQSAQAHVKYAVSLINQGKTDEGQKVFDNALESLEDNTVVKRFYAPYLAQNDDVDRAMDFYEDCLDVAPTDAQLMWEYAQTLQIAGRDFEIPGVLKNLLATNPDPNLRAQALALNIEIEQPKRVESVQNAAKKLEEGDHEGALRELKPLRNWLADYWKMWLLLASAHNRSGETEEAMDAANRLIELFPGCEPAYAELASAFNAEGRHEEAYNVMRYVAQNVSNSLEVAINLGLAAKRAGHFDEAKSIAQQVRELVGSNEQLEPVLREMESAS